MNDYEREHLQKIRPYLAECTVLLKKNGKFPLKKAGTLAAYGNGVRRTLKGGTGSGEVNSRFFTTVEQGLKTAGFQLTGTEWLDSYEKEYEKGRERFVASIKAEARKQHTPAALLGMGAVMPEPEYELPLHFDSDAAIYVLSRVCGEGSDRKAEKGDVLLTDTEVRDILALNNGYERFMLVLNVGGPVDLTPVKEVGNILLLSQLGVETGDVLADILLGTADPSGKLTTTWSAWKDYCPDIDFGNPDDTRYREGIYVGYRWFDTVGKKAAYPFGYGLSYTDFEITPGETRLDGTRVLQTAEVKNAGAFAGKEVLQLYVSAPCGKLDKPYQELAGFVKTGCLKPGEQETVQLGFDIRDMASFDEGAGTYLLEKGRYLLRLGCSSAETTVVSALELDADVTVRKVRYILPKPDFTDQSYKRMERDDGYENMPVLKMNASVIKTDITDYDLKTEIDPALQKLSDRDLARLCVGACNEKGGALSVIGHASTAVAGATGESVKAEGIPQIVMSDGPAGLRLAQEFYRDESGCHALSGGGMVPESLLIFMPKILQWISRKMSGGQKEPPKGRTKEEQYATAIPIGTAIAQSWNTDFGQICGDVVGEEMERFGVHLWLAPAMNIHRSILCGRNFEYYSEDPLISGLFAAAITKGVQKHPGCGTTVKHYAANNQELNRMNSNSVVSERAMREIYLRGFAICVREAQPHALMTSYNLINGEHSSESYGLIHDFLRCENGFRGIVMTDWVIAAAAAGGKHKYRGAEAAKVALAGGDLFMPGCKGDIDNIMSGLASGELSRGQLEENVTRIKHTAEMLAEKR